MALLPTVDRSWFRPRLMVVAILLVLLVAASLVGDRGLLRLYQMHRTRTALNQEIEQLTATNAALAEEVRALRSDLGRVEVIAREELGLVKPEEMVYEFRSARPPHHPADAP